MGKKILALCLDVIMITFFPRNTQRKTIFLILNKKKAILKIKLSLWPFADSTNINQKKHSTDT